MKKLLNDYGFNSDMQYYEMIIMSVINGQRTQAKEQFMALPKVSKKAFVYAIMTTWRTSLSQSDIKMLFDLL